MRSKKDAPVDSMGCEQVSSQDAPENIKRFHILVGLMLSSQTKDAVTYAACQKLHNFGFTPENLAKANQAELEQLLIPVGFYRNKAKFIINTSKILVDEYESDIPDTLQGLLKLPGVGPKMAHIW